MASEFDILDCALDEEWQKRTWHAARHVRRAKEKRFEAERAYDALPRDCPPEVRERAARRLSRAEEHEIKCMEEYWGVSEKDLPPVRLPRRAAPAPAPEPGTSADAPIIIED